MSFTDNASRDAFAAAAAGAAGPAMAWTAVTPAARPADDTKLRRDKSTSSPSQSRLAPAIGPFETTALFTLREASQLFFLTFLTTAAVATTLPTGPGRVGENMGTTSRAITTLSRSGIDLTLVDVGASLEPFAPFVPLLPHATHVAFDPDRRELQDETSGSGRRIVIDKAVIANPDVDKVRFFLTANPTCSSTLRPLAQAVAPYLHAHRFEVVDTAEVAATTLDDAMASVGLDRIDWLKLDTQGTDTRLLRSIGDPLWTTVMAVDAEPGLDPSYDGEDTFDGFHREVIGRGFWLADLVLTTGVRLRPDVFEANMRARSKLQRFAYEVTLKRSPMALGPRYLRTTGSLVAAGSPRRDYLRLWACAFFSGNYPYALDVLAASDEQHGSADEVAVLRRLTIRRNKTFALRNAWRHIGKLSRRRLTHAVKWGTGG